MLFFVNTFFPVATNMAEREVGVVKALVTIGF